MLKACRATVCPALAELVLGLGLGLGLLIKLRLRLIDAYTDGRNDMVEPSWTHSMAR